MLRWTLSLFCLALAHGAQASFWTLRNVDASPQRSQEVSSALRACAAGLSAYFPQAPRKLSVMAYGSRGSFVQGLSRELGWSEDDASQFVKAGAPRPMDDKFLVPPELDARTICHELAYSYLSANADQRRLRQAKWFEEGAAGYLAAKAMDLRVLDGMLELLRAAGRQDMVGLDLMDSESDWAALRQSPESSSLAYAQAASLMQRFFQTHSLESFKAVLSATKGQDFEDAFQEGAGESTQDFYKGWLATTRAPQESASANALVLRAGFADLKPADAAKTQGRFFPALGDYYREASYGAFSVSGRVLPEAVRLDKAFKSYGDVAGKDWPAGWKRMKSMASDVLAAAAAKADLSRYDVVMVVLPLAPARGMAGWVSFDAGPAVVTKYVILLPENLGIEVYAHELGHYLGLQDLYDEKTFQSGSGKADVYMGPWCLMSIVRGFYHLCAYNKLKLGWLTQDRVKTVPLGQNATVTLEPLEAKTQGVQAVKVPLSDKSYYLVELRRRLGFDRNLPDEGLVVTLVDEKVKDCRSGGDCFVKVKDAEPATPGFQHAAFDLRPGKPSAFVDKARGISIALLRREGGKELVAIGPAGK